MDDPGVGGFLMGFVISDLSHDSHTASSLTLSPINLLALSCRPKFTSEQLVATGASEQQVAPCPTHCS